MERAFTRADIEAYFNKTFGKLNTGTDTWSVRDVELVGNVGRPAWLVSFTVDSFGGTYRYGDTLLVVQDRYYNGTPRLSLSDNIKLPTGCATVQEEDEELRKLSHQQLAYLDEIEGRTPAPEQ